jgi:hypothetical protein
MDTENEQQPLDFYRTLGPVAEVIADPVALFLLDYLLLKGQLPEDDLAKLTGWSETFIRKGVRKLVAAELIEYGSPTDLLRITARGTGLLSSVLSSDDPAIKPARVQSGDAIHSTSDAVRSKWKEAVISPVVTVGRDIVFALHIFARNPAFTTAVLIMLARAKYRC